MIFKQIPEILEGRKTQTRRVCKEDERLYWKPQSGLGVPAIYEVLVLPRLSIKWQVGRTYAVVPKRGQPAVWWRRDFGQFLHIADGPSGTQSEAHKYDRETYLTAEGFQPLRIRILSIRREPLQAITEVDARAEGVESVEAYRALWESINGKTKGARWDDNPDVWVLSFEIVTI
jgi:hypothetical protein